MLQQNIDKNFDQQEIDLEMFQTFGKSIIDKGYYDFLSRYNGGYFYNKALQLYGFCKAPAYQSTPQLSATYISWHNPLLPVYVQPLSNKSRRENQLDNTSDLYVRSRDSGY